jgi:hypothetical protein
MIITPVQKVTTCMTCPNFRSRPNMFTEDYICLASNRKIGTGDSRHSRLTLKNKVSDLCPFRKNEVNQRPVRGE